MNELLLVSPAGASQQNFMRAAMQAYFMVCAQTIDLSAPVVRTEQAALPESPRVEESGHTTSFTKLSSFMDNPAACVCGRPKGKGKLCAECLLRAPDYIRENYLNGSPAKRRDAAKWLMARGASLAN